ncbi:MAG: AMP-binding protein [Anaerolineales bacterium]|nr:AMP-binding protein [Anaerolineales bacterium]
MLTSKSRHTFNTLLDSVALKSDDDTQDAIVYVATGQEPIHVSRRAFREFVTAYAVGLRAMGIGPQDLVIIAHTQNLESVYAFWGAMLIGAVPSMFTTLTEKLDPDIYMRNMAELVDLSAVRAVLTTDEFAPILAAQVSCPVYGSQQLADIVANADIDGFGERFKSLTAAVASLSTAVSSKTAFLQHSSGTTGLQKGVALAHDAVLNQLAAYSDALALTAQDVVVSWLPLYHDMGLIAGFLLPLVQGIPLVLMSPFDWVSHPVLLLNAIQAHSGTLCWLPNFAYNHCARRIRRRDLAGVSLATMRLFINCSEPVRHDSHELFLERFASLGVKREMLGVSYAMAENTFAVTQTVPGEAVKLDTVDRFALETDLVARPLPQDDPQATVKVSCGSPIAGTAVRVLDKNNQILPERHVGELAVQSNCMLTEYYRRCDLDPFHAGWYLTGDMGYVVDGEVYVVGRSKDLIINAGKNVYPQDIEAIINTVPGVHAGRAVVFGVPDKREGTELIAVVAEVHAVDLDERKAINKKIRQEVARQSAVTVSYVQLVDAKWLVKTSSGKIARAANRDKWLLSRKRLAS